MESVLFFIAAAMALGGALGVVVQRNPFYSVLSLVVHLLALPILFLLLRAEFIAAAQVIVYAGAVMVLYVFVVAYVGGMEGPLVGATGRFPRVISVVFTGALFAELCIALIGTGLKALDTEGAPYHVGFGTPGAIGQALL